MVCHFTYSNNFDKHSLQQGDLLKITDDISSVLKKYHPHYSKSDYKYFLVVTQSCDLVIRDGKSCNANYIQLAAVRPFDVVIGREVESIQKEEFEKIAGICKSNKRSKIEEFVKRILNNNNGEYFYLHEDDQLGLSEPYCAFLRLSIALRSSEHYQKCLDAKFLQLKEEFKAKLGWLVGNLYSRVGTQDWTPDFKTNDEFNKIISEILERQFVWVDHEIVKHLHEHIKKNKIDVHSIGPETIKDLALNMKFPKKEDKKEAVLKNIKKILMKSNTLNDGADIDSVLDLIKNDAVFTANIK